MRHYYHFNFSNSLKSFGFWIFLLLQSCSESKEEQVEPQTLSGISELIVLDHGNRGDSRDLYVKFDRSFSEQSISEYRVYLTRNFSDLPEIEDLISESSNFFRIDKTGFNYESSIDQEFNDLNGNQIVDDVIYEAFVVSVSNTSELLSAISDPVTVELKNKPFYEAQTLGNIELTEAISLNPLTGTIYTPGYRTNTLYKMDVSTGISQAIERNLPGPLGGNFDRNYEFYYSSYFNSGEIYKYDPRDNDSKVLFASGLSQPTGIAFDNDDNMYVASYNAQRIYKFTPDGTRSTFATSSFFTSLDGLQFVGEDLYAVNFLNSNILKISPNGEVSLFATLPSASGAFTGYITYGDGLLYVPSDKEVYSISLEGEVDLIAGNGSGHKNGPSLLSRFSGPNGIKASLSGDTIFVGDLTRIRMLIKRQ